jgi:acyl-homoserine lactone synthase
MNAFWLPKLQESGWRTRPLGLPDQHDGEWLIAVLIDVTPEALAGLRAARGLSQQSVLVHRDPYRPFIPGRTDVPAVA